MEILFFSLAFTIKCIQFSNVSFYCNLVNGCVCTIYFPLLSLDLGLVFLLIRFLVTKALYFSILSAGMDYVDRGTLLFTFSQFVTSFDIPYEILDNDIHENTEYFFSVLSTGDDRVSLSPNSTRIRILDNDRKTLDD